MENFNVSTKSEYHKTFFAVVDEKNRLVIYYPNGEKIDRHNQISGAVGHKIECGYNNVPSISIQYIVQFVKDEEEIKRYLGNE